MSGSHRFKALLFDFDETLVPEYEAGDTSLGELTAEISQSHRLDGDLHSALRSHAERLINETPLGPATTRVLGPVSVRWEVDELIWDDKRPMTELKEPLGDFRRLVWAEALAASGIDDIDMANEMAERLPAMTNERRVPYSDAEQVLSALGGRHPMAILTNGFPTIQAHKVDNSGLKHHFDHVVLCDEHGAKPDPRPFELALDLLDCRPEEVAMIGNSLQTDIAGAHNAGIYSIWIDRAGTEPASIVDPRPDATVNRLSELLDLL